MAKRVRVQDLQRDKRDSSIACLTAYDAGMAYRMCEAGVDVILVGDSLGMTVQGHASTLPVRLGDMCYHTRCVARGVENAQKDGHRAPFLLSDMPFASYGDPQTALRGAGRLMRAGAQGVKIEGGGEKRRLVVESLVENGVPVCGHLGLQPQSIHLYGKYRRQGEDKKSAENMLAEARALALTGISLLVLEYVPGRLAEKISKAIDISTIGIGASQDPDSGEFLPSTDGQVMVVQDILGLTPNPPPFARNFLQDTGDITEALKAYVSTVREKGFFTPSA